MAVIKTGSGLVDIRGRFGGVYFHRDRSGLHASAGPRNIKRCSAAQKIQRNAFTKARAYSHDERTLSYNIYRALAGLPMAGPPFDYTIPDL